MKTRNAFRRDRAATGLCLSLALTAACAGPRPFPYWADVGKDWGCDPLTVQRENIEHTRARRGSTSPVEVQVGWDACEMLARAGAPLDSSGVFTTGRLEYSVVFRNVTGRPPQRVTLEQGAGGIWRVSAVDF